MKTAIALIALLLLPLTTMAEPAMPEWLHDASPEELMAMGFKMMDLTEENKVRFGEVIGEFKEGIGGAIATEMRRNAPNADRRIRKEIKKRFEDLDTTVKPIVGDGNWNGYLLFKKGLSDQMKPRKRK